MDNLELNKPNSNNDGFATFDNIAISYVCTTYNNLSTELSSKSTVESPLEECVKIDHRKGKRKIINMDGSVSYGLKADGSPRKPPGKKKKI